MFLNRLLLTRLKRDDHGAVLVAVIGVMTVALLLVTLITTSVVSGAGTATATRSGVQSQAAAQAGIAAVRAIVDKSACTAASTYTSAAGAAQQYSVKVYWRADATGTWAAGCPANKQQQVKYVSTGTAAAKGIAGQSARDVSYVEAVYSASSVSSTITGSGAAIYSWGTAPSMGMSGGVGLLNTLAVGMPKATIQVRHGNAQCTGLNLNTSANWVVQDGDYTQDGLCLTVNGNITASGKVDLNSLLTSVTGNVSAGSLHMSLTSSITGNAWIRGNSAFDDLVLARPSISGTLTTKTKTGNVYAGTTTLVPAGPGASPYAAAAVPEWVDYNYTGQAGWPGFTIKTMDAATCDSTTMAAAITSLNAVKGVIDGRACPASAFASVSISSQPNDLAIFVPNTVNVALGGIKITGGTGKLWIIQPDEVADNQPTCPPGGGLTMSGANIAFPNIMIYTPCTYQESGLSIAFTFTGQIYAGQVALGGVIRVQNYVPIGLPGVDLTAGTTAATGPRLLLSTRNVQTG
jgi:hypothetical protein